MVSARCVKIGPNVALAAKSPPVTGSFFWITADAGDATGTTDSATATAELMALFSAEIFPVL